MNYSVVIPVYRGESTLPELVERLSIVLAGLGGEYEILLVNDGSPDHSWDVILSLSKRYPSVLGLDLMRNYGQHNATLCGVMHAKHEIIVTMDDDLQHRPEDIPALIAKLNEGYDVVYGSPRRLPKGIIRNSMTLVTKTLLARVMNVPSVKNISAFRVFRASLRAAFNNFRSPSMTLDVLLSWGTNRFTSVIVDIDPSELSSNYSFLTLTKAAMLIVTGYSTAPLRAASWLGFTMTLFGIGVFVYVLYIYWSAGSLPGFPFLASLISIFGGAQLFALGIFGEYMARMFDRIMDRPPYVVSEKVGGERP
jgi:undecaprenyl-phosphate 4-deoxy-4-formamido-L-arabinose transferase